MQKISKRHKKGLEVILAKCAKAVVKGLAGVFDLAVEMERDGRTEYTEQGQIKKRTRTGKEIKGEYGWRVRTGFDPEKLARQRQLKGGHDSK